MADLNYNHLRYFWAIAHEGKLTQAAERLNVSQSALSTQVKKLEDQLGHALFERQGRGLKLTEAGRIALDYADTVFKAGDELLSTLQGQPGTERKVLRVGAITTLSRNFQIALLRPLIGRADVELIVRSGTMRELLSQLEAHAIDLVLSNQPVARDAKTSWHSHLLQEQPVSIVGPPAPGQPELRFPEDLDRTPILVPSLDSDVRVAFDRLMELAGARPMIVAEVDDMAMLRLFARDSDCLALVPPVVVRDELSEGVLVERCKIPEITESFYAITQSRRFPNPLVRELLQAHKKP
ncbi:MAG: LysR family transcriptional regulator [Myxococcales bacterium SG8_38]|nr:MAG: LysR family transcriptional regulator [Myxococcales bacterium SG8_38]